jgi:hypothetical protein
MSDDMFDPDDIAAEITEEIRAALNVLWDAGFAVAAFCPTELQGVSTDFVEDSMVEAGWDTIAAWKQV